MQKNPQIGSDEAFKASCTIGRRVSIELLHRPMAILEMLSVFISTLRQFEKILNAIELVKCP
jgi:hypothetical protein